MPFLHLSTEPREHATVIAISKATLEGIGEWGYPNDTVRELLDEFAQAVDDAPADVVVEMRDTKYLNHESVAVLFRLAGILANHKRPRAICCSSQVKGLLDSCQLNRLCPCRTDLEEALAELVRRPEDASHVHPQDSIGN